MLISESKLFELLIGLLLKRNGYRVGIPAGKYLKGRGGDHQLDCLAIYPFPAPFVFPTRLIAESKLYNPDKKNDIGIGVVRELHSKIIDLEQTLPQDKRLRLDENWEENVTCNYQGVIFTTSHFSNDAIAFANSYAIDTVVMPTAKSENIPFFYFVHCLAQYFDCCIKSKSPFFSSMYPNYLTSIESISQCKHYHLLTDEDKNVIFILLEFFINNCLERPKCNFFKPELLKPMNDYFFTKRLCSLDGRVVALQFIEGFDILRKETVDRFYGRLDMDPLYPLRKDDRDYLRTSDIDDDDLSGSFRIVSENDQNVVLPGNVRVLFEWSSKGGPFIAETQISNEFYEELLQAKYPVRITVPIDYGCFFCSSLRKTIINR